MANGVSRIETCANAEVSDSKRYDKSVGNGSKPAPCENQIDNKTVSNNSKQRRQPSNTPVPRAHDEEDYRRQNCPKSDSYSDSLNIVAQLRFFLIFKGWNPGWTSVDVTFS